MKTVKELIEYINKIMNKKNIKPDELYWYAYEGEDTGIGFVKRDKNDTYIGFLSDQSVSNNVNVKKKKKA